MAITQTKIPFAYGYCNIKLTDADGTPTDPTYGNGYIFAVDTNSFAKIEEVKYESTTIHNVRKKHTEEIHLSFNLRLREDSGLTSDSGYGDEDAIIRFLHYYPRQTTEDKKIKISPAMTTSGDDFDPVTGVNCWDVLVDDIDVVNVVDDTRGKGQELILRCKTVDPIKASRWSTFFRNTSDDKFYVGTDSGGYTIPNAETADSNIYFSS